MPASVEMSIDIDVPLGTAYNQWTQFESFPRFLEGVVEVRQISDSRLRWKAMVAGREREWEAEITEQRPEQRVAWTAVDGPPDAGAVTFHRISHSTTRVMLQLEAEPDGASGAPGDRLGGFSRRVERDLRRFKDFVESVGEDDKNIS